MSETERQLYHHLRKMLDEVEGKLDNLTDGASLVRIQEETSYEFLEDYIQAAKFCETFFQRKHHRIRIAERLQDMLTDGY